MGMRNTVQDIMGNIQSDKLTHIIAFTKKGRVWADIVICTT